MNYEVDKIIKKKLLGKEVDVLVTNIKVEEEDIYLDGAYTKEELEEILEEEGNTKTLVYGKVLRDRDIRCLEELQKIAEMNFRNSFAGGCSGCGFQNKDYRNELLLEVFEHGEEPEYCDDYDDDFED